MLICQIPNIPYNIHNVFVIYIPHTLDVVFWAPSSIYSLKRPRREGATAGDPASWKMDHQEPPMDLYSGLLLRNLN